MREPEYIGSYSNGLLNIVYQVHEVIGDVYVLEALSYFDMICFVVGGYVPSKEPVPGAIREFDVERDRKSETVLYVDGGSR